MTTPTKEQLAEKLAKAIHDDVATRLFRARERLRVFAGPADRADGEGRPRRRLARLQFDAGHAPQDLDATLERLFELPAQLAADRERRVGLFLDEFQEVVDIDPDLPQADAGGVPGSSPRSPTSTSAACGT